MNSFPTKLFGIIGYPLGHSMSPGLHNWAFSKTGYPGIYLSWPETPQKIGDFFNAVRTLPISGGNITIPHKVAAMKMMDDLSARAIRIGAMNTFYWQNGKLCGENTDITGFLAPIKNRFFRHALILGAGGVSRAVIAGLQELGIPKITITNRTPENAEVLARIFNIDAIPWEKRKEPDADFIINATSLGMKGNQINMTPYEKQWLEGKTGLVYDIVYNPLKTLLIKDAKSAGWETENGLTMFVEQARSAFALWTEGIEMPKAEAAKKVVELLNLQNQKNNLE